LPENKVGFRKIVLYFKTIIMKETIKSLVSYLVVTRKFGSLITLLYVRRHILFEVLNLIV